MLGADRVETYDAVTIENEDRRPLSEAQGPARDVVCVEDLVCSVGHDGVGHGMPAHVSLDGSDRLRRDRQNRGACLRELVVVVAQLREMPSAERSSEPAEEHNDDGSLRQDIVE